jgi:hypothetical protein
MKARNLTAGLAVSLAAAASFAAPSMASEHAGSATTGSVLLKMVLQTMPNNGDYTMGAEYSLGGCFNLTADTKNVGKINEGSNLSGEAEFSVLSTPDFDKATGWGPTHLVLQPTNCHGTKEGAAVNSSVFTPYAYGMFGGNPCNGYYESFDVVTGSDGSCIHNRKNYEGYVMNVTGSGSVVQWYPAIQDFNVGLIADTTPSGGTATIYLCNGGDCSNLTSLGSVSFYSSTTKYNQIIFKYGTASSDVGDVFQINETSGSDMQIVGDAEIGAPD